MSERIITLFKNGIRFGSIVSTKDGLTTGNNEKYIRCFWEIAFNDIKFGISSITQRNATTKYVPILKGGEYRKWTGNNIFAIRFDDKYFTELCNTGNKLPSRDFYFQKYITWNRISSRIGFRFFSNGYTFESASLIAVSEDENNLLFTLGFANSKLASLEMKLINPTTNMLSGYVDNLSIPELDTHAKERVIQCSKFCLKLSNQDWDSFETSWDFSIHPLLDKNIIETEGFAFEDDHELQEYLGNDQYNRIFHSGIDGSRTAWSPIEFAYLRYKDLANKAFYHLKKNEEELNRIFIDIYGLQDELKPEEDDSMVSVHKIFDDKSEIPESMKGTNSYALTKADVVKSLISYAVGCMFGRYSLDVEALSILVGNGMNPNMTHSNQTMIMSFLFLMVPILKMTLQRDSTSS
jgi:hypothetical protein